MRGMAMSRILGRPAGATLVGLAATALVAGCATDSEPEQNLAPVSVQQSELARETDPNVPPADFDELIDENNAFAFDLYDRLRGEETGNLFYSPFSISSALAMTYAGARGETEQQMAAALHFSLPQERLHPAFNALDLELGDRGEGAQGMDGQPFRLRVANSLWGQQGYHFESPFLDVLAVNYGAGMRLVDFEGNPSGSRNSINQWVDEQTEGRIPELLAPDDVKSSTRIVLTNAIYFNARWAKTFDGEDTYDRSFQGVDGPISVPTMSQTETFAYAQSEGLDAVRLPYDGDELSMLVIAPPAGTLDSFESELDVERVSQIDASLTSERIELSLPKFEFRSRFYMEKVLSALGMVDAFDPGLADLSGMTGSRELFIGFVIHEAFVAVNEKGTEAAAATAVGGELGAAPDPVPMVTIDRPFVFLIRDDVTGAILFAGRVLDPR